MSLRDPEYEACYRYSLAFEINVNSAPILNNTRVNFKAIINNYFYKEIDDFKKYFIHKSYLEPNDRFSLISYDPLFERSWLQIQLTDENP